MFRRLLALLAAAFVIGLAAWVSQGSLAATDPDVTSRVGMLPADWWLAVWVAVAAGVLAVASRLGVSWLPFLVPIVVLLPWLPGPLPVAALVWSGPLVAWVWIGTAVAVVAVAAGTAGAARGWRLVRDPARAPWLALALAFFAYCAAARIDSVSLLSGDEPHYLVITQSLLEDRDLQVENNYRSGRYHDYFPGDLSPDFLRRGQNGEIYSIHAPGVPVLVLPVFAVAGYPGVVLFLALLAALGSTLLWRAAHRVTGSAAAAWFGWATVAAGVPTFFHALLVYPDGAAMLFVAAALCALVSLESSEGEGAALAGPPGTDDVAESKVWRWGVVGLALGVLPWMHTRLALVTALLAVFIAARLVARRRIGSAVVMLGVLGAITVAWLGYFYAIYGELNPSAPYGGVAQSTWANVPRGAGGLFFDQQFGLLPNAPAYGVAIVGMWTLFRARRRLAIELGLILVTYTLLVSGFHMWWGGHSAPARLLVPVLPVLALPAAVCWARWRPAGRSAAIVALSLSVLVTGSMVAVEHGSLAFNERNGSARLLEWLTPLVDLPRSAPSFLGDAPAPWHLVAWLAAILLGYVILRLLAASVERRGGNVRGVLALAAPLSLCAAVMLAATICWKQAGVGAITPPASQLAALRAFDPRTLPVGLSYARRTSIAVSSIPPSFRVGAPSITPRMAEGPLLFLEDVPPGVYRVVSPAAGAGAGSGAGKVEVYVARGREPIARWELGPSWDGVTHEVRLPVSVNALIVTGDAAAKASMAQLALQPVSVMPAGRRPAMPRANRAGRYGNLVVFAFTPEVYLEGPGLWVLGGLRVPLSFTVDPPATIARLLLRNGPVANHVTLRGSGASIAQALGPGEERVVEVPVDRAVGGAAVAVSAERGFRPADFDRSTKDVRYLGVWIQPAPPRAAGRQ